MAACISYPRFPKFKKLHTVLFSVMADAHHFALLLWDYYSISVEAWTVNRCFLCTLLQEIRKSEQYSSRFVNPFAHTYLLVHLYNNFLGNNFQTSCGNLSNMTQYSRIVLTPIENDPILTVARPTLRLTQHIPCSYILKPVYLTLSI